MAEWDGPDRVPAEYNQSPPLTGIDLFALDAPLQDALRVNGADEAGFGALQRFGQRWGDAEMAHLGREANECPPRLVAIGPRGERRDVVDFHPAWHALMRESIEAGLHNATWTRAGHRAPAPAELMRAARFYMAAQVETGHLCPITMTRAALAPLAAAPDLLRKVAARIASTEYDPAFAPVEKKRGMTLGMGMTERQGGTDVRTNTTRAIRDGEGYRLTGHKWFMSAPMSDAFLMLAQADGGLTCFFVPRFAPDGAVNALHFQRLKDKLGNRSNASSEVEIAGAWAERVGEEGRGIRTIIEMVQLTRLDCAIASAGLMRAGLAQALHHARYRIVFQKKLADQPMMRAVLADMALEVEAAVALVMRLARALDRAPQDGGEALYGRLLTPIVKYHLCKAAPGFLYEAMECLGGNGYIEDWPLARHYREAPVNAIWEGSGNVMALDALRALGQHADESHALLAALARQAGLPAEEVDLRNSEIGNEATARMLVSRLARLAALAALTASAPADVAEAWRRTRVAVSPARHYGENAIDAATATLLLRRAMP